MHARIRTMCAKQRAARSVPCEVRPNLHRAARGTRNTRHVQPPLRVCLHVCACRRVPQLGQIEPVDVPALALADRHVAARKALVALALVASRDPLQSSVRRLSRKRKTTHQTSAPRLGSPLSHLPRDCGVTALTPPTSAPRLGSPRPRLPLNCMEHMARHADRRVRPTACTNRSSMVSTDGRGRPGSANRRG